MLLVPSEHSPMYIKRIEIKHHCAGTNRTIYANIHRKNYGITNNMGETERYAQKDTH